MNDMFSLAKPGVLWAALMAEGLNVDEARNILEQRPEWSQEEYLLWELLDGETSRDIVIRKSENSAFLDGIPPRDYIDSVLTYLSYLVSIKPDMVVVVSEWVLNQLDLDDWDDLRMGLAHYMDELTEGSLTIEIASDHLLREFSLRESLDGDFKRKQKRITRG